MRCDIVIKLIELKMNRPTSLEHIKRLAQIPNLIRNKVKASQLALKFGISTRTIKEDFATLRKLGAKIEYSKKERCHLIDDAFQFDKALIKYLSGDGE